MPRRRTWFRAIRLASVICLWAFWAAPVLGGEDPVASSPSPGVPAPRQPALVKPPVPSMPLLAAAGLTRPRSAAAPPAHPPHVTPWFRFMAGGVLGPLLWHYAFGYPLGLFWSQGFWPPGLLDVLVMLALCYLGYRLYRRYLEGKDSGGAPPLPRFLREENQAPPPLKVKGLAEAGLAAIKAEDPHFELTAFSEEVRNLLLELYASWTNQDLEVLTGRVKEGLLDYLRMGLKIMSFREEASYLEDLRLETMTITAAGNNDGREHITVCLRGSILDYVVDKRSGKLMVGSMAYPATFQEYWDLERLRGQGGWVLQDIREN